MNDANIFAHTLKEWEKGSPAEQIFSGFSRIVEKNHYFFVYFPPLPGHVYMKIVGTVVALYSWRGARIVRD
jgi:hypothetical protein